MPVFTQGDPREPSVLVQATASPLSPAPQQQNGVTLRVEATGFVTQAIQAVSETDDAIVATSKGPHAISAHAGASTGTVFIECWRF
jgi:hypothetical protein